MGIVRGNSIMAGHLDRAPAWERSCRADHDADFTLGAGLVIEEEGREGARAMLMAILAATSPGASSTASSMSSGSLRARAAEACRIEAARCGVGRRSLPDGRRRVR